MDKEIADLMVKAVKDYVASAEAELRKFVTESIAAIQFPTVEKGDPGEPGAPGKDGADAVAPTAEEVAAALEGVFSKWALGFERKADAVLEKAADKLRQPENGKDGRDALDIEDFTLALGEDGRTVTVGLKRGEELVEKSIRLSIPLDRGVYRETEAYVEGDGVTHSGSFWLAQKDAPEGKPGASNDWRLAVKRGRDGREVVKSPIVAKKLKLKDGIHEAGKSTAG